MAALVAFFLSIALTAGITAARLAPALASRLSGQLTVVIWSRGLESADAAAARAAELLAGQPGVRNVEILEADERDSLIGATIAGQPRGAEQPRLISLDRVSNLIPSGDQLRRLMTNDGLQASIDDHRQGGGPLERQALVLTGLGVAGCGLLTGGFAIICFNAGLAGVRSNNPRLELMTRLGADPILIGATVARKWALKSGAGAIFGVLCAAVLIGGGAFRKVSPSNLTALDFSQARLSDSTLTPLSPVLVVAIAMLTAGLGARNAAVRRERGF